METTITKYEKMRTNIVKEDKKELETILDCKVHSAIIENHGAIVYVYLTYGTISIRQLRLTLTDNGVHSLNGDVKYYGDLERVSDLVIEILSR